MEELKEWWPLIVFFVTQFIYHVRVIEGLRLRVTSIEEQLRVGGFSGMKEAVEQLLARATESESRAIRDRAEMMAFVDASVQRVEGRIETLDNRIFDAMQGVAGRRNVRSGQ